MSPLRPFDLSFTINLLGSTVKVEKKISIVYEITGTEKCSVL